MTFQSQLHDYTEHLSVFFSFVFNKLRDIRLRSFSGNNLTIFYRVQMMANKNKSMLGCDLSS